jgi:CRISPR-associated endonuclease Cas1
MVALDDHLKVMLSGLGATMIKQKKMTRQAFQTWLEKVPFLSRPSITDLQSAIRSVMEKTRQLLAVEKKSQTGEEAEKQIRSDIERKRRQYEEMADAGREIMVSTPGVFIGLTQKGVTLRENGKVRSVVKTHNLQNITVMAAGVSLSEPLIRHCAEERIPIDFIGFNGLPYARLFSPLYPDATIGMAQLRALENGRGIEAVKEMVCGKLRNQLALIKYYYKYRKDTDPDYAEAFSHHTSTISQAIEKIRKLEDPALETVRASVMGLEGTAAAAYWDMIVRLLNNYTFFAGRERQGATDQVNSLLNYGYGVLYSRIWEAVIRERLNPHISYLHVPVDSKPTLAFDLIEEFRQQVVDRSVIALITKGEEIEMEKGQLSPATRKRLVEKILERLNNREKFRGREMRTGEIIRHQARALVRHLKGEKRYKAYIGKW